MPKQTLTFIIDKWGIPYVECEECGDYRMPASLDEHGCIANLFDTCPVCREKKDDEILAKRDDGAG